MANNIGSDLLSPQLWSTRVQYLLKNNLVGGAICNTEERANLVYGYRTHRPYLGDVYATNYTKGAAPTFQNMVATDEYLDVDQAKIIPLYLDDIDKIQNKYNAMDAYSTRSSYQMRNQIDQSVFDEVSNALLGNVVEGGSAYTLSTSNIFRYFSEAKARLHNNSVEDTKPWYAVVDPDTVSLIEQTFAFNGFKVSDEALVNGYGSATYLGQWNGLEMFMSQNLATSVDIVFSDDPTTTTTLIINGVTFTFKSSIGTTAGAVLIDGGSDVDVTIGTNLVAAINNGTAGTTYYQLSDADRAKLASQGISASYAASTNTLTITSHGKMTIGGTYDTGTLGTQTMIAPIGQMGAIDLVIQKDIEVEMLRVTDGRKGTNVTTFCLYGTKMLREGAQRTYALEYTK